MSFYESLNIIDFFGQIGRHFRIATMLKRDSVKSRLDLNAGTNANDDGGLSFTEFSYQTF